MRVADCSRSTTPLCVETPTQLPVTTDPPVRSDKPPAI